MRPRIFSTLVEDCLQRLDQGEDLLDLLVDFPDQADQLQPLLLVAMASRSFPLPVPSQTAQHLGRNQLLAEMNRLEIKGAFREKSTIPPHSRLLGRLAGAVRAGGFNRLAYSYRLASVFLVLILTGGFYTLNASASSQPGDLLYSLKLRMEQAGLVLSYSEEQDATLPPPPWKFGQVVWALEGIQDFFTGQDNGFSTADLDPDTEKDLRDAEKDLVKDLKEAEKDLAAADREEEKDLKDAEKALAAADLEEEKDLKDEEKEADKEDAEADKEEEQDLKEEDKEDAEADKEEEQDLKEDEKEDAEADKEAEKDQKEADKDARQADKEADKVEKDNLKDNKKSK